ncbi:MAG: trehalase family glycosidase [Planctomycetota bacterium]|jgi:alpha,alpha-trehalase
MTQENDYEKCLDYIENYWPKTTFDLPGDKGIHIGLPNPFVSPNNVIFKNDQFYWDSYFIILGLIESGKVSLAKGIVDNFVYLYNRFGIIPMRNRFYNLGISQPPFLTSMILAVFRVTKDKSWLEKAAKAANGELENYWMSKESAEKHLVFRGLSRYCDHYITHLTAEHESGWDMTSRFNEHCLDYLPVDLNSCLYKYETDLAGIWRILGDRSKEKHYSGQAKERRRTMLETMWNDESSFFFDYDYKQRKQSDFYSIAGFYPMWSGLASNSQARNVRKNLHKFECRGGLANTQKTGLSKEFKQHDYPNGWPHQQWIVIKGLLDYGFKNDAARIAKKWLDLNEQVFLKTGKFWEKYNVAEADVGKSGRYRNQTGFGWTNAVFVKLVKEFRDR